MCERVLLLVCIMFTYIMYCEYSIICTAACWCVLVRVAACCCVLLRVAACCLIPSV